ncbi:MAG: CoA transferase [Gammaproteobacteria bacterium]|nr:CoA transferase [Gammaproteobacteria bacterium]
MTLPLAGVRIVAVEHWAAGPYATGYLADLGADVIKIENRNQGGDACRTLGPYFLGEADSHVFQAFNRNKRSLTLDLKHPDGQAVLHRLVATADAFMHNLRGDQAAKLGFSYADLAAANPKVVCAHISAYGREGTRSDWPGFDYLMQAEAGFFSLTGEPDGPPTRFGLSMIDYMTGATTSTAILAGILGARDTGKGRDIDVTLFDVAMYQLTYPGAWYLNEAFVTPRIPRSGHPYTVPSQLFRTRDGWMMVMAQSPKFWELFCDLIDRADLKTDARFRATDGRYENRDALTAVLDEHLGTRDTADWIDILGGRVPCAPVNDVADALESPFFRDRGGIRDVGHPSRPGFKLIASPFRLDESLPSRPGPRLGEDTGDILKELGYQEHEVEALRESGVV